LLGECWIRSRSTKKLDVFDGDGQETGTSRCSSHDSSEEQGDQNLRKRTTQFKLKFRIQINSNLKLKKKNSPAWKPLFVVLRKSGEELLLIK
jgi:hypothetical protein